MANTEFITEKQCSKCGKRKSITAFSKGMYCKDGRRPYCKTCANTQASAYRKIKYEEMKKRVDEYYKSNKNESRRRVNSYYRKPDPDKVRICVQRRRARKLGCDGNHTAAQINELLLKQRGRCIYCKKDIRKKYHADHIIALSRGGSDYIYNIQLLCAHCNLSKHTKDPIDFANQQGMLL